MKTHTQFEEKTRKVESLKPRFSRRADARYSFLHTNGTLFNIDSPSFDKLCRTINVSLSAWVFSKDKSPDVRRQAAH